MTRVRWTRVMLICLLCLDQFASKFGVKFWIPALAPQGRERGFYNFGLGADPVFEGLAFDLAALVEKLLRAQPDLSLQHFQHQFLPFTISGKAVQVTLH